MERRVVVTGLGAVTPIGNNVEEFWKGIKESKCGVDEITLFDTSKFKVKLAAEVKNFNVEDHFDRKAAKRLDRFSHFALVAARELMKDSKILFWYGLIFTLLGIFSCLGSFFANSNLSIVNNVTNNTIASNNNTLINISVFITSIAYSIICIVIGICMIVSSRKKKSNAFILYKALKQK